MIEPGLHRDLGRMEGKIASMDAELQALRSELREVREALQSIQNILSAAGGGWRALAVAGAVGGAIATFMLNIKRLFGGG